MSQKQSPPGFFYKALAIAPLSSDAKAVGGALFDHFNTKTGQCDPSQESLARRLGIAKRTIIDAIDELERFGLFARLRHGGKGCRSAYKPNSRQASLMVADFERRRKAGVAPAETSPLHPKNRPPKRSRRGKTSGDGATAFGRESSGHGATSASGTRATALSGTVATLTLCKNNSSNLTQRAQPEKSHSSDGGSLAVGQRAPTPPRPPKPVPLRMSETEAREEQRRAEAPQAWQRELLKYSPDLFVTIVARLTETDPAYIAATDAELARPGGGLASILAAATGPPPKD
ncbi:helix-turn-helix domain-containing protein [Rhizobium leguminosarum bv. viciae]|uniref:helix-turn-helix domain-containing protein n=1 Tax=Rhizobium leguminosarum TaxID=384 RepID=UPI00103D75EC|nr:helix-turn-helix domain-containing protein [Rhizobium leguminosarum]TBZ78303.1 helix-turn-helix domain-containing protein [Rhizobium leguminosarum bv. viciae]